MKLGFLLFGMENGKFFWLKFQKLWFFINLQLELLESFSCIIEKNSNLLSTNWNFSDPNLADNLFPHCCLVKIYCRYNKITIFLSPWEYLIFKIINLQRLSIFFFIGKNHKFFILEFSLFISWKLCFDDK
jgi:hypothetical protein